MSPVGVASGLANLSAGTHGVLTGYSGVRTHGVLTGTVLQAAVHEPDLVALAEVGAVLEVLVRLDAVVDVRLRNGLFVSSGAASLRLACSDGCGRRTLRGPPTERRTDQSVAFAWHHEESFGERISSFI